MAVKQGIFTDIDQKKFNKIKNGGVYATHFLFYYIFWVDFGKIPCFPAIWREIWVFSVISGPVFIFYLFFFAKKIAECFLFYLENIL
jgi:hypothetical protein